MHRARPPAGPGIERGQPWEGHQLSDHVPEPRGPEMVGHTHRTGSLKTNLRGSASASCWALPAVGQEGVSQAHFEPKASPVTDEKVHR